MTALPRHTNQPDQHKQVLVCGYAGGINVGDEAIIATFAKTLKETFGFNVVIASGQPDLSQAYIGEDFEFIQANYPRRKGVNTEFHNLIHTIRHCEAVYFAGGGLLQDVHSTSLLEHCTSIAGLAVSQNIPVFAFGVGAGPLTSNRGKDLAARFINYCQHLDVRDQYSQDYLTDTFQHSFPNVGVSYDSIFLSPPVAKPLASKQDKQKIGICFRQWKGMEFDWLLLLCQRLIDSNSDLVFLPYEEPDKDIFHQLHQALNGSIRLSDESSFSQSLSNIANLDGLVSMRLHANLFAAIHKIPFVALAYDNKLYSVMESVDLEDRVLPLGTDMEKVLQRLETPLPADNNSISEIRHRKIQLLESIIQSAKTPKITFYYIQRKSIYLFWYYQLIVLPKVREQSVKLSPAFSFLFPASVKQKAKNLLGIKW